MSFPFARRCAASIGPILVGASLLFGAAPGPASAQCRFLLPIGGGGEPWVEKRISPDRLVGRTNWNTDFAVDRSFSSFRVVPVHRPGWRPANSDAGRSLTSARFLLASQDETA